MIINIILLILSIVIYASFGIANLIFILFSILTSYFAARCFKLKSKKLILITTLSTNTLILLFMKLIVFNDGLLNQYLNFNIIVPLGISYYTLQVISYLIDVYKDKYEAETNIFKYMLYIAYIPHLFIGPISRYNDIKETLFSKRKFTWNNLYLGSIRIIWGLIKKIIIASRISLIISIISGNFEIYTGWYVLFAVLMYSIQLYCDFSGGIDIVIGISKILGIDLVENFDSPFYSESIKEFWRRWHITLGAWLKDYIYIPLGGNKLGNIRKSINIFITFFISGIWHGINYILWGIIHGIFVIIGDILKTPYKWFNRLVTFIIVSILWAFFIWNDTLLALNMIGSIFTNFNITDVINNILNLGLTVSDWIILVIFISFVFIYDGNKLKIKTKLSNISTELKLILICTSLLLIIVFGMYGIGFNVEDFIYSNF